jgi:DNA-binding response OmpR family regulator
MVDAAVSRRRSHPKPDAIFFYFPEISEPVKGGVEVTSCRLDTSGGSETILLVEDEATLREGICEFLRLQGYTVLAAGDGMEAMRICETHAGTIDLLLTDLVLPRMDGLAVANSVASHYPCIHILCISGYTERAAELIEAGATLLGKPFSLSALASKLRKILEARGTA